MILQNRDLEILRFIAKFGYVNNDHIAKLFGLTKPRLSQLLKRLIVADYIKGERILLREPTIYTLRNKATELIKCPRFKKVSLQNLKHNLLVIDVYIDLKLDNPSLEIMSDRDLRLGRKIGKVNTDSIPDLVIKTGEENGKKDIAIEIEISRKNRKRIKTVIAKREREYLETYYYCSSSVYSFIKSETQFKNGFKVFDYFNISEDTYIQPIAEKVEQVKTNSILELKDLKIKNTKLESEKKALIKDIGILKSKVEGLQKDFANVDFKKATFGSSYSLSSEDLEKIKNIIGSF